GVDNIEFLSSQKKLEKIQNLLAEKGIVALLSRDEEHGLFELIVDYQVNGMSCKCCINMDLIKFVEYRNLYKIHKELESFKPPYKVFGEGEEVDIENEARFLDYIFQKGKKGITIQRYKGLGEMAPQQLWETTMNPEVRFLQQVSIQDAVEAEGVFTTLMGGEVEPRRAFIEKNALEAQNLDI
ncbi:DNA gyrase subunit B, partial [Acidobacteriota bacterium]